MERDDRDGFEIHRYTPSPPKKPTKTTLTNEEQGKAAPLLAQALTDPRPPNQREVDAWHHSVANSVIDFIDGAFEPDLGRRPSPPSNTGTADRLEAQRRSRRITEGDARRSLRTGERQERIEDEDEEEELCGRSRISREPPSWRRMTEEDKEERLLIVEQRDVSGRPALMSAPNSQAQAARDRKRQDGNRQFGERREKEDSSEEKDSQRGFGSKLTRAPPRPAKRNDEDEEPLLFADLDKLRDRKSIAYLPNTDVETNRGLTRYR